MGDPTLKETNLGPVVSLASAARIRKQVADASVFLPLSSLVTRIELVIQFKPAPAP
jgi:hypothetical protein